MSSRTFWQQEAATISNPTQVLTHATPHTELLERAVQKEEKTVKFDYFNRNDKWGTLGIFNEKADAENFKKQAIALNFNPKNLIYHNAIRVVHSQRDKRFYVMSLLSDGKRILTTCTLNEFITVKELLVENKEATKSLLDVTLDYQTQKGSDKANVFIKGDYLPYPDSGAFLNGGASVEEYIEYWEARQQKSVLPNDIETLHWGCIGVTLLNTDWSGTPPMNLAYTSFETAYEARKNKKPNTGNRYAIYALFYDKNISYPLNSDGTVNLSTWDGDHKTKEPERVNFDFAFWDEKFNPPNPENLVPNKDYTTFWWGADVCQNPTVLKQVTGHNIDTRLLQCDLPMIVKLKAFNQLGYREFSNRPYYCLVQMPLSLFK
jgi:hypothetical protein